MQRECVFASTTSALLRAALFGAIWIVLAGPDPSAWIIGAPTVWLATWVSLRLSAPRTRQLSILGALRFVPFFLWESLRGGIDVASRVMRPCLRIEPGTRDYRIHLRNPAARLVYVDCVSLLPGTLSADLRGDRISVHALDITTDMDADLRRLERRVADLFGERLEEPVQSPAATPGHGAGPKQPEARP